MIGAAGRRIATLVAAAILATGLAGCGRPRDSGRGVVWRARCDADTLDVGDPLILEIEGRWPQSLGAVHLAWGARGDSLLVMDLDSTRVDAGSERVGWSYRLRCLATRSGRVRVPPAALVAASGETLALASGPLLRIGGRIVPGMPGDLRPMAPMASLRRFPWWVVVGGAALVAAAVATLLWLRHRRRRRARLEEPPPLPPGIEFAEAVSALVTRGLPERGEMRVFTQELSWILRRYLGRRWERPALASTRPEIVSWLPVTGLCVRDQGDVAAWLERTDRIKFAGDMPLLADAHALLEAAQAMVERTEKRFEPPPAAEGEKAEQAQVPPAASGGER